MKDNEARTRKMWINSLWRRLFL